MLSLTPFGYSVFLAFYGERNEKNIIVTNVAVFRGARFVIYQMVPPSMSHFVSYLVSAILFFKTHIRILLNDLEVS